LVIKNHPQASLEAATYLAAIYDFAAIPAASTIASKAFGSSIAISLSIFRFRAILAFLQPLMN
jgi:hypothetical protein